MFTRPGYRLGDSWTFFHQDTYHLFYLTCPQEQPLHKRWDIGHASSPDAFEWTDHGEILHPGQPGAWDGICPATGGGNFDGEIQFDEFEVRLSMPDSSSAMLSGRGLTGIFVLPHK